MPNLFTIEVASESSGTDISQSEINSIIYHDIFDYPLSFADLIKWRGGEKTQVSNIDSPVSAKKGFYFVEGHEALTYKRALRERVSAKKLEIAKKALRILSFLPTVKMIAVTGSLAMQNSTEESDIDLLIVTKKGTLWTTRLFVYLLIGLFGISKRSPMDKNQRDKLCLNMWLDESDLSWRSNRNMYTAHEVAQILPLVNKDKTYEKFLFKNKWILSYWPNAVRISNLESRIWNGDTRFKILDSIFGTIEKISYWFQYQHMKSKMTREVATATRALFHPQDWSEVVLRRIAG